MSLKYRKKRYLTGFTLIDLMIVVAIIGILAAAAMPKFADLINKSHEAKAKGNLAAFRSALRIYYGSAEGESPTDLYDALVLDFIKALPEAKVPIAPHTIVKNTPDRLDSVRGDEDGPGISDRGSYNSDNLEVWIECTHEDTSGSAVHTW